MLVKVIQHVYRKLKEEDQEKYKEEFEAFMGKTASHIYRPNLEEIKAHIKLAEKWMNEMTGEFGEGGKKEKQVIRCWNIDMTGVYVKTNFQ